MIFPWCNQSNILKKLLPQAILQAKVSDHRYNLKYRDYFKGSADWMWHPCIWNRIFGLKTILQWTLHVLNKLKFYCSSLGNYGETAPIRVSVEHTCHAAFSAMVMGFSWAFQTLAQKHLRFKLAMKQFSGLLVAPEFSLSRSHVSQSRIHLSVINYSQLH